MARSRSSLMRRVAQALGATVVAALVSRASATAPGTPKAAGIAKTPTAPHAAPVTDATVAERVLAARTRADHEALAAYYTAKAAAEAPRMAYYDQLFHAYMKLEGKQVEPLQRHARALLKAARMSKQRYELLAQAHLNLASATDARQ